MDSAEATADATTVSRSFECHPAGERRAAALGEFDHHRQPGDGHLHAQRGEIPVIAEEKIEPPRLGIGVGLAVIPFEAGDRVEQQREVDDRHDLVADMLSPPWDRTLLDIPAPLAVKYGNPQMPAPDVTV